MWRRHFCELKSREKSKAIQVRYITRHGAYNEVRTQGIDSPAAAFLAAAFAMVARCDDDGGLEGVQNPETCIMRLASHQSCLCRLSKQSQPSCPCQQGESVTRLSAEAPAATHGDGLCPEITASLRPQMVMPNLRGVACRLASANRRPQRPGSL